MIGKLSGILLEKQAPDLVIDVNGVGYEVKASMGTFYRLPELGEKVSIHTHLIVREDAQALFGFADERERLLFRNLIKVNGVGPKLALAILSSIEPDRFVQCIADQNATSLTNIPGVGKKTAERLIIEMRDRLASWFGEDHVTTTSEGFNIVSQNSASKDAISALIALGYKQAEANKLINRLKDDSLTSEELIRLALREMSKC